MCGRYVLGNIDSIEKRFSTSNTLSEFTPSWNITPGSFVPTIIKNSPNRITMMRWGLIPHWAKDTKIGLKMINARSEDILKRPVYKNPFLYRRCIIPVNGFYEWKTLNLEGKAEKFPWYICLEDQSIFGLAGVYDIWKDAQEFTTFSFSIITTSANKIMSRIHSRMPVILKISEEDRWLNINCPTTELLSMLTPFPDKHMVSYPVSKAVNNPSNDGLHLINKPSGYHSDIN